MNQTKIESAIERTVDMISAFIISVLVYEYYIYPSIPKLSSVYVVTVFTAISFVRGYVWRRFFNRGLHKAVHNLVRKNMSIQEEHTEMVKDLAKSGERILSNLTPERVHRMHMAVGISGEAGEILLAFESHAVNHENLTEELGDTEFYLNGLRFGCGFSYHEVNRATLNRTFNRDDIIILRDSDSKLTKAKRLAAGLAIECANALDLVKKEFCYNKDIDDWKMLITLAKIEYYLSEIRDIFLITRDKTLEHNLNKLRKGDNARYKNGYSDEAAQVRADKA